MNKQGFTLIEVMIAVMIIATVIAAFLTLRSNAAFLYQKLLAKQQVLSYSSLVLFSKYDKENDTISLDNCVERFDLDDDLRRKLKQIKVKVTLQKQFGFSLDELNSSQEDAIEIQKIMFSFDKGSFSLERVVQ